MRASASFLLARLLTPLLVASAVELAGAAAHAAGNDRATAEALFRAGRQAMEQGDFAHACARFAESNRLDPALGTLFNLGACNEKLGKLAEAWQYFSEVAQRAPAGDDRATLARSRADAIETSLGHLTLALSADAPEGSTVLKDGVELGPASLGVELPLDPGDHVLVVRSPGRADRETRVTLKRGERRSVTLEPGAPGPGPGMEPAAAPAHAATGPAHEAAPGRDHTLGYVLLGVGAVGIVTSLVAGIEVLAKKSVVQDHCAGTRCDQTGYDAGRAGKTFGTIGTVSFAIGAVAMGGGIVLLTTGGPERPASSALAPVTGVVGTLGGRF